MISPAEVVIMTFQFQNAATVVDNGWSGAKGVGAKCAGRDASYR